MVTFPRTKPGIVALAQEMVTGLTANAAVYADPPIAPAALTTKLTAYTAARNAAVAAQAATEQATLDKDDALAVLTDDMKRDIRYAENTVAFDDAKLKLIGWSGKATAQPSNNCDGCALMRDLPEPFASPRTPKTLLLIS